MLTFLFLACTGDIDSGGPAVADCADTWFADIDGDGFGDRAAPVVACPAPEGHVADATDCNDGNADVHPGGTERCGGGDEDCDGRTDDADSEVADAPTWFADADGDGAGTDAVTTTACEAPEGYVATAGDCDDFVYVPGGVPGWYADADRDGYGEGDAAVLSCEPPPDLAPNGGDCDDADDTVHPGAVEHCDDGRDTDCDGTEDDGDAVDAGTWFPDTDADGWGDDASPLYACDVPSGALPSGGDCDDSDGAINPDATEICANGIDEDCDGGPGPVCGISGTYTTDDADITLQNDRSGAYLGSAVAGGVDGDGDGFDDVVVSDITADVVYLLRGPVSSMGVDPDSAVASWSGLRSSYAGRSVAWVGDTDGDGKPEWAIGQNGADSGGRIGAVFLVDGDSTGEQSLSDVGHRWMGESAIEKTADSLAGVGDVNGDGVDDLLVGTPRGGDNEHGKAFLLLGPITESGDLVDADAVLTGNTSHDEAGCGVTGTGDWDGDGLADFAVGASGSDYRESNGGIVYIVSGTTRGATTLSAGGGLAAAWGGDVSSGVGCSLAGGADLDGDGATDLVISGEDTGRVHVLSGPLSGGLDLGRLDATWTGAVEVSSVALAGDVNGDGFTDVLVGDHRYDSYTGVVYLLLAPMAATETSLSAADASIFGTVRGGNTGFRVSTAGDHDADGYDDVLIGAYDADEAWIFQGGGY